MSIAASSQSRNRPEFVTLIAIYQFVTAGILLLMSCLIPAALFPFVVFNVDQNEGIFAGLVIGTAALALFLGFAFASIVVGWGLLRMREWARLGAIVLAAFALIGFPIWTIVAILILVYMTSEDARYAFRPEEAPPEIRTRTISTADPDTAARAAYKSEPPDWTRPSPAEETRRIEFAASESGTNGAPSDAPASDETRRLDIPIPMPPPQDPSEATESLYDHEGDVSDHYRRWKASLPQEPLGTEGQDPEETEEQPDEDTDHARWRPADPTLAEAATDDEATVTADGEAPETVEGDITLASDQADTSDRVWGPAWAFETVPGDRDAPDDEMSVETGDTDEEPSLETADDTSSDDERPAGSDDDSDDEEDAKDRQA